MNTDTTLEATKNGQISLTRSSFSTDKAATKADTCPWPVITQIIYNTDTTQVASLNPSRCSRKMFFSRVNFLFQLLFSVDSDHVLLQWHGKDPGHCANSARGKLYLNMHIHPWSYKVRVGWLSCPRTVWEPIRETSSHTIHQGMLDHSCLTLLSHCGLTDPGLKRVELMCANWSPLTKKEGKKYLKKKSAGQNCFDNFPKNHHIRGKSHHTTVT